MDQGSSGLVDECFACGEFDSRKHLLVKLTTTMLEGLDDESDVYFEDGKSSLFDMQVVRDCCPTSADFDVGTKRYDVRAAHTSWK